MTESLKDAPFPSEGSRAWLDENIRSQWRQWKGNPVVYSLILQTFLSLGRLESAEVVDALLEVKKQWDKHDPVTRSTYKTDDFFSTFIGFALFRMAQVDPEAALDRIDKLGGRQELVDVLVSAALMHSTNDTKSLQHLVGSTESSGFQTKLKSIVASLALTDPAKATSLLQNYSGIEGEAARARFVDVLASSNPKEATATAVSLMARSADSDVLRQALERWFDANETEALSWAANYSGVGEFDVKAVLLTKQHSLGPLEAQKAYINLISKANDKALSNAAVSVVELLATQSPETARNWLDTLPQGQSKIHAVEALARSWMKADPYAASQWIGVLPHGPEQDAAVLQLVSSTIRNDPASAYHWASTLSSPTVRSHHQKLVLEQWRQQDPEAANAAQKTRESLKETVR